MRIPRALSPSAFMLWEKDPIEYALKYLVDNKPPRMPQPLPASVGSAFDAFVKSKLHADLFGAGFDPKFELDTLLEQQVEEHNVTEARGMGKLCFESYVDTGSYDELLQLMENAKEAPEFEFDAGNVIDGVPLFGKPDCRFVNAGGAHIILDWKVKGYCSKYGASPTKGYAKCRDGVGWLHRNFTKRQLNQRSRGETVVGKPSRSNGKEHDKYKPIDFKGVTVNEGFLETCNVDWATQLSIYGWILGEKVGDENVIVCVDEIVGKYMDGEPPLLRVANHKSRVSSTFQVELFNKMKQLWTCIKENHIFVDMTLEDSQEQFEMLQKRATGMSSDGSEEEDWYSQLGRPTYR